MTTRDVTPRKLSISRKGFGTGYMAPAASLTGAVLENGFRSIGTKNGITVRSTDNLQSLNNQLGQESGYSRLTQKKVSVWIDLRNAEDHGQLDQPRTNDVSEFINGEQSLQADYL